MQATAGELAWVIDIPLVVKGPFVS
jgi:hypothetical protein